MSHTPGPWRFAEVGCIRSDSEHDRLRYIHADSLSDALMASVKYYPWTPTNRADWLLIAAAPDLLEALKALYADYKRLADSGDAGFWSLEDQSVGQQALAAIAKAEGQ